MGKKRRITPKPRRRTGTSPNLIKTILKEKKGRTAPLIPYQEYTGAQVNAANVGIEFIKLTNKSEKHNGFQFKTGENRDTIPFYPHGSCEKGGIYFCKKTDAYQWLSYGSKNMHYFRPVTLPNDARVYVEDYKMKTNKFILGERETIFTNRTFFDNILQNNNGVFIKYGFFQFDKSFYDERTWTIIFNSRFINLYAIPVELRTDMFRDVILKTLGKNPLKMSETVYALGNDFIFKNDDIIEKLISHGLTYGNIPRKFENRQVLRCFLRMGKLEQAGYFPQRMFLDETLLEGIRTTRALEQLVAEKKQYARN